METLHRQALPGTSHELTFRRVDIERDLDLVWGWWTAPHVQAYWSYAVRFGPKPATGYTKDHLRRYWLDKAAPPGDFVAIIAELNGIPAGYIEDYRVAASPLAGHPLLGQDDRGFHAMMGNLDFRGTGLSNSVGGVIVQWQRRAYPLSRRTVMEPDAANAAAIHVALKIPGAKRHGDIQLPHKKAALIIVEQAP